jgi:hypothetical protein
MSRLRRASPSSYGLALSGYEKNQASSSNLTSVPSALLYGNRWPAESRHDLSSGSLSILKVPRLASADGYGAFSLGQSSVLNKRIRSLAEKAALETTRASAVALAASRTGKRAAGIHGSRALDLRYF